MSVLAILWPMLASFFLTLAVQQLVYWAFRRHDRARLLFAVSALAAAGLALCERAAFTATSVEEFAHFARLGQLPLAALVLSLVWLIRVYLASGRRWLAIGSSVACGGMIFFIVIAVVHATLNKYGPGLVRMPFCFTLWFMPMALAVAFELSRDAASAASLSEALGASERRWNVIRENSPFLLLLTDGQGCIEYVNPYFSQITGTSATDVVGRPASDLLPANVVAGNAHLDLRSSIRKGIVKAHDGTDRSVVWWTARRDDGVGPGSGTVSIGLDVTGQVIAEAALDEAVARLRSAVRERDGALEANSRVLAELDAMKKTLEERVLTLQTDLASTLSFPEIVGGSDAMRYVLRRIEQVAPLQTTVVIEGETGVGKELVARAIHQRSARGARAMVTVNCAALPPTLVEDELFGHERGAFTGAHRARKGKFELADGSTLFLDELAELPLEVQGKLLRALQEGTFERVGGTKTLKVNVRVIAATSKNLIAEVEAGRFRQDLYYRLQVYPLSVPALRQRKEDIPALVEKFVGELAGAQGKHIDRVPQQVLDELCAYEWPGNVRELRNVIERGVIHSTDGVLLTCPPTLYGCEREPG